MLESEWKTNKFHSWCLFIFHRLYQYLVWNRRSHTYKQKKTLHFRQKTEEKEKHEKVQNSKKCVDHTWLVEGLCQAGTFIRFIYNFSRLWVSNVSPSIRLFIFFSNIPKNQPPSTWMPKILLNRNIFITKTWFLVALLAPFVRSVYVDDTWSIGSLWQGKRGIIIFWQRESLFPHNVNKKHSSDDVRSVFFVVVVRVFFLWAPLERRFRRKVMIW